MDLVGVRAADVARPRPEAEEAAERELEKDRGVRADVVRGLPGLAADVGDLALLQIARQLLPVEHGEDRFVQAAGGAGPVAHPHFEADGAAQRDECVKPDRIPNRPRSIDKSQRKQADERRRPRNAAGLEGQPTQHREQGKQQRGIDERDDAAERSQQDPMCRGGRALVVEDERDDADQSAFRQARLPENGGDEPQRRRDRPECAGHGCGAAVKHLDGDVHHQPDGREAEQDVQQHDGERSGKRVAAEDQEDACDESGITRRNKGGGAGGTAEGRAVTLAM